MNSRSNNTLDMQSTLRFNTFCVLCVFARLRSVIRKVGKFPAKRRWNRDTVRVPKAALMIAAVGDPAQDSCFEIGAV